MSKEDETILSAHTGDKNPKHPELHQYVAKNIPPTYEKETIINVKLVSLAEHFDIKVDSSKLLKDLYYILKEKLSEKYSLKDTTRDFKVLSNSKLIFERNGQSINFTGKLDKTQDLETLTIADFFKLTELTEETVLTLLIVWYPLE